MKVPTNAPTAAMRVLCQSNSFIKTNISKDL